MEDVSSLKAPNEVTNEDEVFLRQHRTYSDLSSSSQIDSAFLPNPAVVNEVVGSDERCVNQNDSLVLSEESVVADNERPTNSHDVLRNSALNSAFAVAEHEVRAGISGTRQLNDSSAESICNKVKGLALHPCTDELRLKNKCETSPKSKDQLDLLETAQGQRGKKRLCEFPIVSRAEHKRWRQEIDGFTQYSEWVAKVSESRHEELPELEAVESIISYDPAEEYFFRASVPLVNDEELAEINNFVERVNKKIDEQEKEVEEMDANLQDQKKMWSRREEWDPFFAEKLAKKRNCLDETKHFQNVQLFICFACGRAFDDEKHMRDHVNSVHLSNQGYDFKCFKCYRRFKTKQHLVRHEATHDDTAVFKCDRCSSAFRKKDSLKVHQSRVHRIDESGRIIKTLEFECSHCNRHFGTPIELTRHRYSCLKIKSSSKMEVGSEAANARTTSQPKPSCSFSPRPLLSKVCHVCQNKFASTQSLIRHIGRKHPSEQYIKQYEVVSAASTPNLPFACIHCQKRFATKSGLSLHKKRHLGDCPYQCNTCGRKYPIASELRKHIRRTHEKSESFEKNKESMKTKDSSGTLPSDVDETFIEEEQLHSNNDLTDFTF